MNGSNLGHFLWDPGSMNVTKRPPTRFKSLPVDPGRMNVTITPPSLFFVPKIILAQSIKAYFGGSLRKQPSLCEASWAAVFAVWSWAPWLGVMWREWWRKSFFENHSLHDPQHVLGLGSPFFIDYVVNFRVQYTVIKSALRLICIFSALVSDRQLPRYFNNDNYTVVTGKKINGMYISFLEIDALLNPLFCF